MALNGVQLLKERKKIKGGKHSKMYNGGQTSIFVGSTLLYL